jgi:hypothetical protein
MRNRNVGIFQKGLRKGRRYDLSLMFPLGSIRQGQDTISHQGVRNVVDAPFLDDFGGLGSIQQEL